MPGGGNDGGGVSSVTVAAAVVALVVAAERWCGGGGNSAAGSRNIYAGSRGGRGLRAGVGGCFSDAVSSERFEEEAFAKPVS